MFLNDRRVKTYLGKLQQLYNTDQLRFYGQIGPQDFAGLMKSVRKNNWIVYAKAPFAGPGQVLDYLGRYTHRVAISNHRLVSIDKGQIRFTYKDRSANNCTRIMTVTASEFLRRFLLHVCPGALLKTATSAFLFHRDKRANIVLIRKLLNAPPQSVESSGHDACQLMLRISGIDIHLCPRCRKG